MAQFLIRQAHGGETQTVSDGALPFFLSQGWVIVDTLDDSTDPSPIYITKAESDLRYIEAAGVGDPGHPDGAHLRAFFETKINRSGAVTGQVPVLQADGSLLFANTAAASGGVTSVNGKIPNGTGAVTLVATDVGALASTYVPTVADLPAGSTLSVSKAGGVWPARPTSRADITVIWKGADPSPAIVASGTAGMLNGDLRVVTP